MAATRKDIPVGGVWLRNEGNDMVVLIERDGTWYEAIREAFYGPTEGTISHTITASGIESMDKRVDWLYEEASQGIEGQQYLPSERVDR